MLARFILFIYFVYITHYLSVNKKKENNVILAYFSEMGVW